MLEALNFILLANALGVFGQSNLVKDLTKIFEITKTIYSNSERSEQFLVTECFSDLFLEVSHI